MARTLPDDTAFAAALVGAVVMARAERAAAPFQAVAGYLFAQVRASHPG